MDDTHPVRCKFFDDDGNPIDNGCRFGRSCRYIHPSDSIWKTIAPHRGRNTQGHFKDGRTGRRDGLAHSSRASRNLKHDHEKGQLSRGGRDAEHTRELSSGISGLTLAGDSTKSSTPIVGKPDTPTLESYSTWNSEGGWETEGILGPNPWGETSTTGGDRGDIGWGDHVWGDNNETTGVERAILIEPFSYEARRNKVVGADGLDITLPTNQSTPNPPSLLPGNMSCIPISNQQETLDRPSPPPKPIADMATIEPITRSSSTPEPAVKRPRLPLPTRLKQGPPAARAQVATDDQKFPLPSPVVFQDWCKISTTDRDDAASDVSSLMTTHELHSKAIMEITHAVLIRYDLINAEEKKDKWRMARQSPCYYHSTPAAQKILESINHKYSEELAKLHKQLSLSLRMVVKYTSALNECQGSLERGLDMGLDVRKVMTYTNELRDWVANLKLPKRLSYATSKIDAAKRRREAIKRQKKEKVTVLRNVVHELELAVTDLSDDLVHVQDTQPERFQEAFHIMDKLLEEEGSEHIADMDKLFSGLGVGTDAVTTAKQRIRMADQKMVDQFSRVEGLATNLEALEIDIANLKQNEVEIATFCQEASTRLKKMEMWKQNDKAQLEQFSKRIETLYQQGSYSQSQNNSFIFPCKVDDLLPYSDALVTAYVMQEIKPALDAIVAGVDTSSHHLTSQFNKLTEDIVVKTHNLIQTTLKINGLTSQLHL